MRLGRLLSRQNKNAFRFLVWPVDDLRLVEPRGLLCQAQRIMVVAHSFHVPGDLLRPLFGNDPRRLCVPP